MELLANIKNKKIFVLSPHYDDAILSCGMLMEKLSKKNELLVINVFTRAHKGPYTMSGKKFLKEAGFSDAALLFADRKKTDKKALAITGIKSIDLEFVDALFRKKRKTLLGNFIPEFDHIYPTYKYHLLRKVSKKDDVMQKIVKKLSPLIPDDVVIVAPFGIGNHADHIIVRKAAESLGKIIVYYTDFPYNLRLNCYGQKPKGFRREIVEVNLPLKEKMIRSYTSQVNALFKDGIIPEHNEQFFVQK